MVSIKWFDENYRGEEKHRYVIGDTEKWLLGLTGLRVYPGRPQTFTPSEFSRSPDLFSVNILSATSDSEKKKDEKNRTRNRAHVNCEFRKVVWNDAVPVKLRTQTSSKISFNRTKSSWRHHWLLWFPSVVSDPGPVPLFRGSHDATIPVLTVFNLSLPPPRQSLLIYSVRQSVLSPSSVFRNKNHTLKTETQIQIFQKMPLITQYHFLSQR